MRSALHRVCPKCGSAASGLTCPLDGFATVPREDEETANLAPGSWVLDRFLVDAFIEQDGAVALHRGIDKQKAPCRIAVIKLLPTAPPAETTRMLRAAQALEQLADRSLAKVLASGLTDNGDLAIVSELPAGHTLEEHLKKGPLGSEKTMELGVRLLAALEAAHAQNIAHHDLAPARVRVGPTPAAAKGAPPPVIGQVTVTDMGFADILRAPNAVFDESPTLARGASYRAPEQARARAVTLHADIYSVGAILYEALTGKAFAENGGDKPGAAALKAANVEAPLAEFVTRCLEKKPWNRFDTAGLARQGLEAAREAIEQAGPIGQARLGEIAWEAPKAAPATRETQRPGDANTSGLLNIAWPSVEDTKQRPMMTDLEPVAPIARTMVQYVRPKRRGWIALAAALVLIAGGSAIAAWRLSDDATAGDDEPAATPHALIAEVVPEPVAPDRALAEAAKARAEAEARAEVDAKARLEAEAKQKLEAEAEVKAVVAIEAKAKLDGAARLEAETEAKALAEAETNAQLEAEAQARALAEAQARTTAEANAKALAEAEAKAQLAADAKARIEAEAKAKLDAARVRIEAEAKAKLEAEAAKIAAAEKLRLDAEPKRAAAVANTPDAGTAPAKKTWSERQAEEQEQKRLAAKARAEALEQARLAREAQTAEAKRIAAERKAEREAAWKIKVEEHKREQQRMLDQQLADAIAKRKAREAKEKKVHTAETDPTVDPAVYRALLVTEPPGASVLVDGSRIGTSPLTLTWPAGSTTHVWVMLEGHLPTGFDVGDQQNTKMLKLQLVPTKAEPEPVPEPLPE